MAFFFASEKNRRSANEDSYCKIEFRMNEEAAVNAMVVADGMGGLSGGRYYSQAAVNLWYQELLRTLLSENFRGSPLIRQIELLSEFSRDVYGRLNQILYKKGLDAGLKGGTTLSAVIHFWDTLLISNCGDSPVYCVKDGNVRLASEIQNVAERMVREGKTKRGSIPYYQNKNRILDYLGKREGVSPFFAALPEQEADAVLLGSDGAFGDLSETEIAAVLSESPKPQKILPTLFEKVRAGGEEDNQTAIFYVREKKDTETPEPEACFPQEYSEVFPEPEARFPQEYPEPDLEETCCYTEIAEPKITDALREKFRKNRFMGGW